MTTNSDWITFFVAPRSIGSAIPPLLLGIIGPTVRKDAEPGTATVSDYLRVRLGRVAGYTTEFVAQVHMIEIRPPR